MRAYDCKVLLCATALILVSSGADARYWRHYGYHWHGQGWTGSRSNSDEPQVEKQLPQARNEARNQGDFSAAIQDKYYGPIGEAGKLANRREQIAN
jgi:hypothetical protein